MLYCLQIQCAQGFSIKIFVGNFPKILASFGNFRMTIGIFEEHQGMVGNFRKIIKTSYFLTFLNQQACWRRVTSHRFSFLPGTVQPELP